MKIVCVLTSPRDPSNSSAVAMRLLEGAKENGHEAVVYNLNDMDVKGCQGCGHCKQHSCDCIVEDDLHGYWKELHECDALVIAAPNYCAYPCGPAITYMNRHYCLLEKDWKARIKPGIKLVGVFSQGNPDRERFMPAYDWFLGDFLNRGMVLAEKIVHIRADGTDEGSEMMLRAYNTGKSL